MQINKARPRLIILMSLFLAGYSIIIINLYCIQIKNHSYYAHLGEQQYQQTIVTTPPRAPIFDRNGNYLALNKESFSAFIVPKQCRNLEIVSNFISQHFPDSMERLNKHKSSNFFFIKRKLSDREIKNIKTSGIEDIKLLKEPNRYYPCPAAGLIVGLTNVDNKGILGLELQYDCYLSGQPTMCFLERDARMGHFHFKKETLQGGQKGNPLTLTIDQSLQFLVSEELKEAVNRFQAKEGAAIVMNPKNGEILSMVCMPDFDPNKTENLAIDQTKNRIISERYELGSVIKIFAALAATEEGSVTNDELIDCQNKRTAYVDGRKINTVSAHGKIPFAEVIARSNNIGTATVVKRIEEKLYDHYVRLGFTKKTNLPLPGEQVGFVNPPSKWSKQSVISLSYGYEIAITLIELARAFSIIAHNGHWVEPQLIKKPTPEKSNLELQQLYSQTSIDSIKNILEQTTTYGTARRAAIKGYRIMSKTGTANTLENGAYVPNKNVFTCAGIVEKGDYQRVIVAFIKEADPKFRFAARVAAPLFERIAEKTVINDKIV